MSIVEHNNSVVQIQYDHGQVQHRYVAGENQEVVLVEREVRNSDLATDDNNTIRHGDGLVQHINPNIQHDMDLWQRICEYDKGTAEVSFTPVLSNKQQKLKQA